MQMNCGGRFLEVEDSRGKWRRADNKDLSNPTLAAALTRDGKTLD